MVVLRQADHGIQQSGCSAALSRRCLYCPGQLEKCNCNLGGGIKTYNSFHHNKLKMNITKFSPVFTLKKEQQGQQVVLI